MDRQGTPRLTLLVYLELEDAIDDLLVPGSDTDGDCEEKEDDDMEGGVKSDDSVDVAYCIGRYCEVACIFQP